MVNQRLFGGTKRSLINVRSQNKKLSDKNEERSTKADDVSDSKNESDELNTLKALAEYWGATNPLPMVTLAMNEESKQQWKSAYLEDPMFKNIVQDSSSRYEELGQGRRFFVDRDGMIFFNNEDYQPRLCVPVGQRNFVLKEAHESPLELAHAGPEHLWHSLSPRFYWKRMKLDIIKFCRSCDMCQKTINHRISLSLGC